MERPSEDIVKRMQTDARDRLHAKLDLIKETYEANKPAFEAMTAATEHWCTGTMTLTSVVVNTGIKISNIEFKDFPEVLKFKGTSWGLGIGYGASFGTGVFTRRPKTLNGMKVTVELLFAFVVGGVIQTSFWDEGELIGAMDFIGGGGGAGLFVGNGKFSAE